MRKVIWNFRVVRTAHYVRNGNTRFVFVGLPVVNSTVATEPQRYVIEAQYAREDLLDRLIQAQPDDSVSLVFDEREDFGPLARRLMDVSIYVPAPPAGARLLTT